MKQHQLQIQSIIKNVLAKPLHLTHIKPETNKIVVRNETYDKKIIEIEHLKKQISSHNEQLQQLSCALSENYSHSLSQVYEQEESDLKNLLIKEEFTKCQNMLEDVILVNEALRIRIKEYEVDNLKLPSLEKPKTVAHVSVQTHDTTELLTEEMQELSNGIRILNECLSERQNIEKTPKSEMNHKVDIKKIADFRSVVTSTLSSQCNTFEELNSKKESVLALEETVYKMKINQKKRKKQMEKLILKNFSLKIEICELKNEIKKYSNIWANDRYFNSLFLDSTKKTNDD